MTQSQPNNLESLKAAIAGKINMHIKEGTPHHLARPVFVRLRRDDGRPDDAVLKQLSRETINGYGIAYVDYGESGTPGLHIQLTTNK